MRLTWLLFILKGQNQFADRNNFFTLFIYFFCIQSVLFFLQIMFFFSSLRDGLFSKGHFIWTFNLIPNLVYLHAYHFGRIHFRPVWSSPEFVSSDNCSVRCVCVGSYEVWCRESKQTLVCIKIRLSVHLQVNHYLVYSCYCGWNEPKRDGKGSSWDMWTRSRKVWGISHRHLYFVFLSDFFNSRTSFFSTKSTPVVFFEGQKCQSWSEGKHKEAETLKVSFREFRNVTST